MGLWLLEVTAGTIGFLWPNLEGKFGGEVAVGTLDDVKAENSDLPIDQGFPAYVRAAQGVRHPRRPERSSGSSRARTRPATARSVNVRALYQRCPHLGCKPNPCLKNFWLECPCHGSRYDRLGIKAAGPQYGPAPRSMDRFGVTVDGDGVLTVEHRQDHPRARCRSPSASPGIDPPRTPDRLHLTRRTSRHRGDR